MLERLVRQYESTGDPALESLLAELRAYPRPDVTVGTTTAEPEHPGVLLPLQLRTEHGVLSFISTVTVFGTPHDITLQELAIETFFPADDATQAALERMRA